MLMAAMLGNPDTISVRCEVPHDAEQILSVFVSTHDVTKPRLQFTRLTDDQW